MRRPLLVAVALAAALGPAPAAAQGPPERPADSLAVQTEPKIEGARFILNGRTYRTDAQGRVLVRGDGQAGLRDRVQIPETLIRRGLRVQFSRRREGVFLFNRLYSVSLSFVDLEAQPIAADRVSSVTLKGSHGARVRLRPGRELWLQGSRVVPFQEGYREKRLEWVVERVVVDGQNVVNKNQQRFTPATTRSFRIALLFYPADFTVRDAVFGFPTGTRLNIRHPSGRVEHHRLSADGKVSVPSLPRGEYLVSVDGPGFSFQRPLALSKKQEVELELLSYLDIGAGAGALAAIAVGLLLLGGRRPLTRRRRRAAEAPVMASMGAEWLPEIRLDLSPPAASNGSGGPDTPVGACDVIGALGARRTLVVCPTRAHAVDWAARLRRLLPEHEVGVLTGAADERRSSQRALVLVAEARRADGLTASADWDLVMVEPEPHRLVLSGAIVRDRADRLLPGLQELLREGYGEPGVFTVHRRRAAAV